MKRTTRRRLMDRKIVEHLLAKRSQRWICSHLKVGDRRVRRVFALAEGFGYLDATAPIPPYPEALFPDPEDKRRYKSSEVDVLLLEKKAWIEERLAAGWFPVTVFEELDISVTRSSFYRFLHRHNIRRMGEKLRGRVVPEIVHEPGEALLLDWGKLRDVVDPLTGKKKALWAFVGVLGFSRYMMVRLVWTNSTEVTLNALENFFRELNGVPGRLTTDNPKCFALEASNYEPLLNPAFERFANHYGVTIECLPPGDPEKKGKVERPMPYVRRLYQAHGKEWHGLEESQAYMDKKVKLANDRIHGTTRRQPSQDFTNVEAQTLKALPAVAYEIEDYGDGRVRKDGHIRFDSKYYSLAEEYIGESVFIIANSTSVNIYHKGKLAEVHNRLKDPMRSKSTKKHHLKPWEQAMKDDSLYRKRARKIGPDVERLVGMIIEQGQGFIDTRKVWGILSLDKKYESNKINEACRRAIEYGSLSYRSVRGFLNLIPQAKKDPKNPQKKNDHKFVRPISEYAEQLKLIH